MTFAFAYHKDALALAKSVRAKGEEVIIAKAGKPVAKLVKIEKEKPKPRRFGSAKGTIKLLPGWDDPFTEEELIGE